MNYAHLTCEIKNHFKSSVVTGGGFQGSEGSKGSLHTFTGPKFLGGSGLSGEGTHRLGSPEEACGSA